MSESVLDLISWAKSNGAEIPHQVGFFYDEFKGICAVCEDDSQDVNIRIPANLIISRKFATGKFAPRHPGDNTGLKFLLAFWKVQGNGPFQPYIRHLPSKLDSALVWNPLEWKMLRGTNLGSSVREKLSQIYSEWLTWLKYRKLPADYSLSLRTMDDQKLYDLFLEPASKGEFSSWCSFPAFLWSHLIFLSRAFPEYVMNRDAPPTSVILVPLLDLLNHDVHSKVQWYNRNNRFCMEIDGKFAKGQELFNNYGAKGNEELLAGYGFVLEDNEFDYVALRIKLSPDQIHDILENQSLLKLPSLDDYTTFAFEESKPKENTRVDPSEFQDGVRFFINAQSETCLYPLLDLFSYLSTVPHEHWTNLRSRLQGLQSLRAALKFKQDKAKLPPQFEQAEDTDPGYRRHYALVYRQGQLRVLKYAIASLKRLEKHLLVEYRHRLLDEKKMRKGDEIFEMELKKAYENSTVEELADDDNLGQIALWVLIKSKNNSFQKKSGWVGREFKSFARRESAKESPSQVAISLYPQLLPQEQTGITKITSYELQFAVEFVKAHSYTRLASSSCETILVEPESDPSINNES